MSGSGDVGGMVEEMKLGITVWETLASEHIWQSHH
jgi:hypothetical protein